MRSLTLIKPRQKERQQRALGAAFLAHQVSELEKSVDTLAFSRDPRLYGRGGGRGRGRGGRGGGSNESRQDKREVRVVDASALVHVLPVLKRWIREDRYQLVVPLSGSSSDSLLSCSLFDPLFRSFVDPRPPEEGAKPAARSRSRCDPFPRGPARHCSPNPGRLLSRRCRCANTLASATTIRGDVLE